MTFCGQYVHLTMHEGLLGLTLLQRVGQNRRWRVHQMAVCLLVHFFFLS
jgi:hypothetical protein